MKSEDNKLDQRDVEECREALQDAAMGRMVPVFPELQDNHATQRPRGRPFKTTRSIQVNCCLPEDIVTRMKLYLWSDAEGKVPHGSQSGLIEQALREFFGKQP